MSTEIRLFGAVPDSIVDGPGLRYSVFVQGCSHNCPGCHNPESHDAHGGTLTTIDAIMRDIASDKLVHDVTLSGGEPFEQAAECAELAHRLKDEGYGVWAFTGYLYEDLLASPNPHVAALLDSLDVLVDGPFVEQLKSLELGWRGSSNQRVIDLAATRTAGHIVEWSAPVTNYEKPENW